MLHSMMILPIVKKACGSGYFVVGIPTFVSSDGLADF